MTQLHTNLHIQNHRDAASVAVSTNETKYRQMKRLEAESIALRRVSPACAMIKAEMAFILKNQILGVTLNV